MLSKRGENTSEEKYKNRGIFLRLEETVPSSSSSLLSWLDQTHQLRLLSNHPSASIISLPSFVPLCRLPSPEAPPSQLLIPAKRRQTGKTRNNAFACAPHTCICETGLEASATFLRHGGWWVTWVQGRLGWRDKR